MTTYRFGKSSGALLKQKTDFFSSNERLLEKQNQFAKLYIQQPLRTKCKNCGKQIDPNRTSFKKNGVGYLVCDHCDHLNGIHEDTFEFCEAVYAVEGGQDYAKNYDAADKEAYDFRTSSIYIPKADFLYTSLKSVCDEPNTLKYLDFGTGTGYFVSALKKIGLKNVMGTDVSKTQTILGNQMIGEEVLSTHSLEDTTELLSETKADVVSMIGVLEHLQDPRSALEAIQNNDSIKYYFISVPLFGLSVYIEMLRDDIFHRHLSSAHTHLYTKKSLEYLQNEFGLTSIAEWWFGADIVDLFRFMKVSNDTKPNQNTISTRMDDDILPVLDNLQMEVDKSKFSSEVHILFKKI